MASTQNLVPIPHSARSLPQGAQPAGAVDPNEVVHLTIRVRRRTAHEQLAQAVQSLDARPARERKYLSREEFARTYGANPDDLQKVEEWARQCGLSVEGSSAPRRSVHVSGKAEVVRRAFGVELERFHMHGATYRRHTDHVKVPQEVAPLVEAVVGFDTRPHARPHFRIAPHGGTQPHAEATGSAQPHASLRPFNPTELGQLYRFPPNTDGSGQVVGIIELMAPHGSGFRPEELKQYFTSLGVNNPEVVVVSVDGGANSPGNDPNDPQCADGEVMLDIEVVGALAPRAKIVVYFAPNTAQGFLDVISRAVHDTDNNPSVISLSWGAPEDPPDQTTNQIHQVLQAAAAMGVTFCVASGDSGSRDNPDDPDHAHVDFPASSPFALGCGGTRLLASGQSIHSEVAWPHSGGGVSRLFDLPSYQAHAHVPPARNPHGPVRRGVPDVAGAGDPATGYNILVDGQSLSFGGTSAVAPLWAALVARLNQKLGHPVGFLNPFLYAHPKVCNDIKSGNNGDYHVGSEWDPVTGLGSPDGTRLLEALQHGAPSA